jgi:hypothetical protein
MILHVFLFLAVIVIALGVIVWRPGLFPRPWLQVAWTIAPFLILGVISSLMQSVYGSPTREWVIPALAALALGVFCRSERAFRYGAHAFLIAAIVLWWNFADVVLSGYTADPVMTMKLERSIQGGKITTAARDLRKLTGVFPAAPVSAILHQPQYDAVTGTTIEWQWHTPLTGLYRVHRTKGSLWYPGGDVVVASRGIKWRPVGP